MESSSGSPPCFICRGAGEREVKLKIEGRKMRVKESCKNCGGKGYIMKSKRRNEDGSFRPKVKKSYPSFVARGPLPCHAGNPEYETTNSDEDLCYLVGEWRIFQRIDKHRYSTDDLVTSWIAVQECTKLGHTRSLSHHYLDIGCGIGSVLMSTAWQLPNSICTGVEVQQSRHEQAVRSIAYNLGTYPEQQTRCCAYQCDLRDWVSIQALTGRSHFDLITGTPPYFNPSTQAGQTTCTESLGCLFEMKGSIDQYCSTASKLLRTPEKSLFTDTSSGVSMDPSLFVVCHSSLHAASVYMACYQSDMIVLRRTDVVPRVGKPPLFSVFVTTLRDWLTSDLITTHYPNLQLEKLLASKEAFCELFMRDLVISASLKAATKANMSIDSNKVSGLIINDISSVNQSGRVFGSVYGEEYDTIIVRAADGTHTEAYAALLRDLSKPSSFDREIFDPAQAHTTTSGVKSEH